MRIEQVHYDQTPEKMEELFKDRILNFIAQRGSNPEFTRNEIAIWQQYNSDGMIMKHEYQTEKELDNDWDTWCAMIYDDKVVSDTMAIKLYGVDNQTIYSNYKTIFLRKASNNPKDYDPSLTLYSQQNSILKDMIQGVKSDRSILYQISEAYDIDDNSAIENLNRQAFTVMRQSGYCMITAGADSIEDLNRQYYNYQSMSRDKRSKADTYSLQIYGMDNEQHYKEQLTRLHNPDYELDTPPPTIEYQPTEESSNLISLNAILDRVHDTDDLIEASRLVESTKNLITPSTIVEETLFKVMEDEVEKKAKKLEDEQPLGFTPYFFLPDEIEELGAYSEDSNLYGPANSGDITPNTKDWLYSYYAKAMGLRPPMRWSNSRWRGQVELLSNRLGDAKLDNNVINSTKQSLLEIGWNPEVKYDQSIEEDLSINTNKRFLESFNERYKFLDIIDAASIYDDKVEQIPISDTPIMNFYFFYTSDDMGKVISQEVYIGLDVNDDLLYPIVDGLIKRRVEDFDNIIANSTQDTTLKVYSIGMAKTDVDKIQDVVHRYSVDTELSKYSMINHILKSLDIPMVIENEKLFCAYIIDMIVFLADNPGAVLEPVSIEDIISSRHIRKRSLRHVYLTYSGKASEYTINTDNKQHFFGKFVKYSLSEDCNPYSYMKVIPLLHEVTTLPIEFDKDGNLFIKKKENVNFAEEYSKCHKLLVQYSKAKGYEAMKYYVAKLWYMNILIEKKLHDKKKNYTKEQLTSWYNTRAHILADFKKYMGEILENEPNFDFEKYYSTTPFDKSTLKVSNTFLRTVWNMLRSLLGFYVPSMPKK